MTREKLIETLQHIENGFYYQRKQWVIDFFENEIGTLICALEEGRITPFEESIELGALAYQVDTVMEIMIPDITDYNIMKQVYEALHARIKTLDEGRKNS